jgi:NADH-quinone oxidoreductase subunit I
MCEEACPTTAIQLTPDFELAEYHRQDLVYEKAGSADRRYGQEP